MPTNTEAPALLTTDALIAGERKVLLQHARAYRENVRHIRKQSLEIAHANELAYKLAALGCHVSSITLSLILVRAGKGCDEVMRTVAQLESMGYLFDYDEIKFDGVSWIDMKAALAEPDARLPEIGISFNMSDTPSCTIVTETTYEMQPVTVRKLVCP